MDGGGFVPMNAPMNAPKYVSAYEQSIGYFHDAFAIDDHFTGASDVFKIDKPPAYSERETTPEYEYGQRYDNELVKTTCLRKLFVSIILAAKYRQVFSKYEYLNRIQSKCFQTIMNSEKSIVVSAPTGAGKTGILELALIKNKMESEKSGRKSKCVYLAPTKALCTERSRDWKKLEVIGLTCCELTGDTVEISFKKIFDADIMNMKMQYMSLIDLVLIDEVHLLNEKRGSTLEVVVCRMMIMKRDMRIVAVSATVPNVEDIGLWIKGEYFKFGDEYRPVPLEKVVLGYPRGNKSDFLFEQQLDYQIPKIIEKYSNGLSSLVFCSTRKSCIHLAEYLSGNVKGVKDKKGVALSDKKLGLMVSRGIGYHHAGLNQKDREIIEEKFRKGEIKVLCSTSTLAVGVNLPAHLVVIKSTQQYSSIGYEEYSELDILQMIGRAGRPQFDSKGIAIIMTMEDKVSKYENICSGNQIIESCLHENLIEHLNAEIMLGTIKNESESFEWIKKSFLYQRIKLNPNHYKLNGNEIDKQLNELIKQDLNNLSKVECIKFNETKNEFEISSTELGKSMGMNYIKYETIKEIIKIDDLVDDRNILLILSKSKEFESIRFQQGEKGYLNQLNKKFKMKINGRIKNIFEKVFVLIQMILSDQVDCQVNESNQLTNNDKSSGRNFSMEMNFIIFIQKYPNALLKVIKIGSNIKSSTWDDNPKVLMQVEKIGKANCLLLNKNGIITLNQLASTEEHKIESICKRLPPFGKTILENVKKLPNISISINNNNALIKLNNPSTVSYKNNKGRFYIHLIIINDSNQLFFYEKLPLDQLNEKLIDLKNIKNYSIHAKLNDFSGLDQFINRSTESHPAKPLKDNSKQVSNENRNKESKVKETKVQECKVKENRVKESKVKENRFKDCYAKEKRKCDQLTSKKKQLKINEWVSPSKESNTMTNSSTLTTPKTLVPTAPVKSYPTPLSNSTYNNSTEKPTVIKLDQFKFKPLQFTSTSSSTPTTITNSLNQNITKLCNVNKSKSKMNKSSPFKSSVISKPVSMTPNPFDTSTSKLLSILKGPQISNI
ncbi:P-loop containing nucleoside triphosphate hydrolase protein [Rozella allomycis CSF55]|uniref:DNA 3'-5' helicase n=1 Tax=Rozella allomycis (strain CSF55) TaxID=988480 RepID=A0A4V1IZJ1_ROZAC|nr:P-loop containing nucleoside triphosphate hydrolase protein [Rozella allomycis CSF55]